MAGSRFIDLYTDVETITNVTGQRAWVKRLVNQGCARVATEWEWPFLWTTDFFSVVANYTTGTVSITVGSATVTGTSTVFTAAHAGRKIRFGSEAAFYTIKSQDSTTQLTLDQLYQGTTNTAATYSIYQDTFLLRADVDVYKIIRQMQNGVALFSLNISDLDWEVPSQSGTGPADFEVFAGRATKTYTTGTLSGTSGSRILTGASTPAWTTVQGLGVGSKVQVGSSVFTVKSVDSATQLTIYEALPSAIIAGTAYTIILDNPTVQLYSVPIIADNYFYRFQRLPAVLDADQDYPDLPPQLHPLILAWVLPWLWEFKGMPDREAQAVKNYRMELADAIARYSHYNPDRVYRRRDADPRFGRDLAGFPSNYGPGFTL